MVSQLRLAEADSFQDPNKWREQGGEVVWYLNILRMNFFLRQNLMWETSEAHESKDMTIWQKF